MINFFRKIRYNLMEQNKTGKYLKYAVDKFFVEVVYDGGFNAITEVRSFKYGRSLDKYSPSFK